MHPFGLGKKPCQSQHITGVRRITSNNGGIGFRGQQQHQNTKGADTVDTSFYSSHQSLESLYIEQTGQRKYSKTKTTILDGDNDDSSPTVPANWSHPKNMGRNSPTRDEEKSSDTMPISSSLPTDTPLSPPGTTSVKIIRWLESLRHSPHYPIIAQACEEFWQCEPVDGNNARARNSTTRQSSPSSRRNRKLGKRKAGDREEYNEGNGTRQSETTETPLTEDRERLPLACHFNKMDYHLYLGCSRRGFDSIGHLMEHLRKHNPGPYSCPSCWRPSSNPEQLLAHTTSGTCRPVGGTPVHLLEITKKHMGSHRKWFWIWDQLFPLLPRPRSPYLTELSPTNIFQFIEDYIVARYGKASGPVDLEDVLQTIRTSQPEYMRGPLESSTTLLRTPAPTQIGNENGYTALDEEGQSQLPIDGGHIATRSSLPMDIASASENHIEPPDSPFHTSEQQDSCYLSALRGFSSNDVNHRPSQDFLGIGLDDVPGERMPTDTDDPESYDYSNMDPKALDESTGENLPPFEDPLVLGLEIPGYFDYPFPIAESMEFDWATLEHLLPYSP